MSADPTQDLHERLESVERSLDALRDDLEAIRQGVTIHYAADFLEIWHYLHPDSQADDRGDSVSLLSGTLSEYRTQALHHLFLTIGSPVVLLPSHAHELFAFIRREQQHASKGTVLAARSDQVLARMNSDEKMKGLLSRLLKRDHAEGEDLEEALAFIQSDYLELCDELGEFLGATARSEAIHALIREGKIQLDITRSLPATKSVLSDVTPERARLAADVLGCFSSSVVRDYPVAKMRDASALVELRAANEHLRDSRQKIVLISHDSGLRRAVSSMAKGPNGEEWRSTSEATRGLSYVFFHLVLRGYGGEDQKLRAIDSLLDSVRRLRATSGPLGRNSARRVLSEAMGRQVVKNVAHSWASLLNLRLSVAASSVDWLKNPKAALADLTAGQVLVRGASLGSEELASLVRRFVLREDFRNLAIETSSRVSSELAFQALKWIAVRKLGDLDTKRLQRVFASITSIETGGSDGSHEILRKGAEHSHELYFSVRFTAEAFDREVQALLAEASDPRKFLDRWRSTFTTGLRAVATGRDGNEAYLFFAYCLGLMSLWEEAAEFAGRVANVASGELRAEALYVRAVCMKRRAMTSSIPNEKLLCDAYRCVEVLVAPCGWSGGRESSAPADPRYIKEAATIALAYWHVRRRGSGGLPLPERSLCDEQVASEATAKAMLRECLNSAAAGERLRIEVLNNLIYQELIADGGDLEGANVLWSDLQSKLAAAQKRRDPAIPTGRWPSIEHTGVMLKAQRARKLGPSGLGTLGACITELKSIADALDVDSGEAMGVRMDIERVRGWTESG